MDIKKKALNFSIREESILVRLVRKYKHILDNKKTDTFSNKNKMVAWTDLAKEYNLFV